MDKLNLQNPVFATYVIAATVMILKAVGMSWLTVVRMTEVKEVIVRRRTSGRRGSIPIPIQRSLRPTSGWSASAAFN